MDLVLWLIAYLSVELGTVAAHMRMKYPHPRGDPTDTSTGGADYNLSSPLSDATMCQGKGPGKVTATFHAGETVKVKFEGSARHGGGLCQFSLSYDDASFVVIQEITGGCPDENYSWPIKLPDNLPNCDRCTFAWTWINAIGNRELYMNCADVSIIGGTGSSIHGQGLYIANLPGYPTYQPTAHDGGPDDSQIIYYPVEVQ